MLLEGVYVLYGHFSRILLRMDFLHADGVWDFTFNICLKNKGITVFKIFIWGGISWDIRSEITFYGSARASP